MVTLKPALSALCSLQPGYAQTSAMLLCTWRGKKKPWQPLMHSTEPCSRVVSWLWNSPKPSLWSTRWDPVEIQQVHKRPGLSVCALLLPLFTHVFASCDSLQVDFCRDRRCPSSTRVKQRCLRLQQQLQLDYPYRWVWSGAGLAHFKCFFIFISVLSLLLHFVDKCLWKPHPLFQVQQSVHNSFFNTTSFDPTYAALKGITSSKGADGMIYGALASQVYGSVADQVYQDITNHDTTTHVEEVETPAGPDPTVLFEAARAKFFQEGQKVFFKNVLMLLIFECTLTDVWI